MEPKPLSPKQQSEVTYWFEAMIRDNCQYSLHIKYEELKKMAIDSEDIRAIYLELYANSMRQAEMRVRQG